MKVQKEKEDQKILVLQREADAAGILLPTQYNRKVECPCTNKAKYGGEVDDDANFFTTGKGAKILTIKK